MHFWLQIIFRCMTSKLWVGHSSSNFLITIKVGRAAAIATDAASLSSTKRSFGSFRNANDFLSYRTLRKPSHLRMVFDFTSRKRFGGPSEIFKKITILIRNKPIWTHLPSMHVAPGGPSTWRTKKCKKMLIQIEIWIFRPFLVIFQKVRENANYNVFVINGENWVIWISCTFCLLFICQFVVSVVSALFLTNK